MLTLIEKIEQHRLKKNNASIFTIEFSIFHDNKTMTKSTYEIYAKNELEAEYLGEKLRYREQKKLEDGESTYQQWGLDYKESLKHKWGFIAPWKDPIYKRSLIRGTRLPILRFKAAFNVLVHEAKNTRQLHKKNLSLSEINTYIQRSIVGYFSSIIIIFCGLFCVYNAINSKSDLFSIFILGAIFCFFIGLIQLAKIAYNHKLLLKWKAEKNA